LAFAGQHRETADRRIVGEAQQRRVPFHHARGKGFRGDPGEGAGVTLIDVGTGEKRGGKIQRLKLRGDNFLKIKK